MRGTSGGTRDFFISFNKSDRPWATWIAWMLEENGYSVFFQDWDFRGNFVLEMDRAHTSSRRTIAVLSPDYLKSRFAAAEWAARFREDADSEHDLLIPVRVRPCEPSGMLGPILYVDLVGRDEATAREQLLCRIRGIRYKPGEAPKFPGNPDHKVVLERPAYPSPYPGLSPFEPQQGPFFFGRNGETNELVSRLRDADCRFLAIVGASGTGKSSLVYAGLFPRLYAGDEIDGSQTWIIRSFRPSSAGLNPFSALAFSLESYVQEHRGRADRLAAELERTPASINRLADQVLAEAPDTGAKLLLFIDQLEDLFTHSAERYRRPFVDLLAAAVCHARVRIVTTLREDFLSLALQYPKLASLCQARGGTFPLSRPGRGALREIVRCPAERAGSEVEDDLVEEIVSDAGDDLGALPLIAFCLEELWQSVERGSQRPRLTVAAYERIGRLQGAIAKYADAATQDLRRYGGSQFDERLNIVFSKLVAVQADRAIRRQVLRAELDAAGDLVPDMINKRLLFAEGDHVELAQDALLDRWPVLKDWIDEHRADLILSEQLLAATQRWKAAPRRERHAYLWHSYRLRAAKALVARWHFTPVEKASIGGFIEASEIRRLKDIAALCAAGAAASTVLSLITLRYITPSLVPRGPLPVASYDANGYGMYDVHGNVWEWTKDCAELDRGVQFCKVRGGSWDNHEQWKLRADYWEYFQAGLVAPTVGFRVVREVDLAEAEKNDHFKDCEICPEMVIIKQGSVRLRKQQPSEGEACPPSEAAPLTDYDPVKAFAIGKTEITVRNWKSCLSAGGDACNKLQGDEQPDEDRPVVYVRLEDAEAYVNWLKDETGKKTYRLPTSAEWEYAAKGGRTESCYQWGNELGRNNANCSACGLTWRQLFDALGRAFGGR